MVVISSVLFAALAAQPAQAQQDGLSLFKNYFITGDYVVRGTSLWRKGVNGKAVADIPKLGGADGVTPDADIVAAFLYIQTAEKIQGSGIDPRSSARRRLRASHFLVTTSVPSLPPARTSRDPGRSPRL